MDKLTKECRGCGESKPLSGFNRRIGRCADHRKFDAACEACAEVRADPGNYRGRCRACQKAARAAKPKRVKKGPAGPPRVIPPEERKHACPADIRRAFRRAQTRHADVADLERALAATPRSHEQARHHLRVRLENARAWAAYSLGSLDSLCAFATASLEKHPRHRSKRKTREIRHLIQSVEDWKRVLVVRYRLENQSEVYTELRAKLSRVISFHAHRSAREVEEAEQQADLGILKAVEQWDPTDSRLAKFSTYTNFKIRREAQARKDSHTAPGKQIRSGGKVECQGSINAPIGDDGSQGEELLGPVSEDSVARSAVQMDVRQALANLPLDQAVVLQAKASGQTLKEIAAEQGLTVARVRTLLAKAKETMRDLLAEHAPTVLG